MDDKIPPSDNAVAVAVSGHGNGGAALPARFRSLNGESPWQMLTLPKDDFFRNITESARKLPDLTLVDLRHATLPDRANMIQMAGNFYREQFNGAGREAGISVEWSKELAHAQLGRRLQQPGIAHLYVERGTDFRAKPAALFLVELAPGLNGPRGVELDVIVRKDLRRSSIGSRITLFGFNELSRLSANLFGAPLVTVEAETYIKGFQEGMWDRVGFKAMTALHTAVDTSAAVVTPNDLAIRPLTKNHLNGLRNLTLSRQNPELSLLPLTWAPARFSVFLHSLEKHLKHVESQKTPISSIMYVAETPQGNPAAFFSAHPTIRRNGQVVLTTPYSLIARSVVTDDGQRQLMRAFFTQAAKDSLVDARRFGATPLGDVTSIEYGTLSNPAFFQRRGIGPTDLDREFYCIKLTDFEGAQKQLATTIFQKDPYAAISRPWRIRVAPQPTGKQR